VPFRDEREALAAKVRALASENEELRERLERATESEHTSGSERRGRTELESVAPAVGRAAKPYLSQETERDRTQFIAYVSGLVLAAVLALIWRVTDGDWTWFLSTAAVLALAALTVLGAAVYRAIRDFTKNW
jgi:cell division septum initiation protein DivIVA